MKWSNINYMISFNFERKGNISIFISILHLSKDKRNLLLSLYKYLFGFNYYTNIVPIRNISFSIEDEFDGL